MKRQISALFITILISCTTSFFGIAQTQLSKWYSSPNIISFLPSGSTPTITNGLASTAAGSAYNSISDNSGNLVFYIANGNIYNNTNNLIGTLPNAISLGTEIAIIPNPNNSVDCNSKKYYIVYLKSGESPYISHIAYGVVDMAIPGGSFTLVNPFIGINATNLALAVSPLNSNNERFLYISNNFNSIHLYKVTANSIINLYTPISTGVNYCSELELSNNGDKLVCTDAPSGSSSSHFKIFAINPLTGVPIGQPYSFSVPNCDVYGLEFDNSGNKLFYSSVNTGVFVKDLTQVASFPPYMISGTNAFGNGMLEKSYNGNEIICASISQIRGINPTTNSLNSWIINLSLPNVYNHGGSNTTFPNTNIILMPDQIDGENYQPTFNLTPNISGSLTHCSSSGISVSGSSNGTVNNHFWELVECDMNGNTIAGGYSWSSWYSGSPAAFTFPGSTSLACNKYYRVKLAVQNACVNWAETTKIVYLACSPNVNIGPDQTICKGSCVDLTANGVTPKFKTFVWTDGLNTIGNGTSINVCPTQTTNYCVTVTVNATGCSATDCATIFVESVDPGFSTNVITTNSNYVTVTATKNVFSNLPAGFGDYWRIDELDANLNPISNSVLPVVNPTNWWFTASTNFAGFDGLVPSYSNSSSVPGKFKYNTTYKLTRGVWSNNCGWKEVSYYFHQPSSPNADAIFINANEANSKDLLEEKILLNQTSSIAEQRIPLNESIAIYPNPANDFVIIDSKNMSADQLEITDLSGRVQLKGSVDNNLKSINISNLSSGTYLINIYKNELLIESRKLIIQH